MYRIIPLRVLRRTAGVIILSFGATRKFRIRDKILKK